MKPHSRVVMDHVLESAIAAGIRQHYKHREEVPETKEQIAMAATIYRAIIDMMEEWFIFEEV